MSPLRILNIDCIYADIHTRTHIYTLTLLLIQTPIHIRRQTQAFLPSLNTLVYDLLNTNCWRRFFLGIHYLFVFTCDSHLVVVALSVYVCVSTDVYIRVSVSLYVHVCLRLCLSDVRVSVNVDVRISINVYVCMYYVPLLTSDLYVSDKGYVHISVNVCERVYVVVSLKVYVHISVNVYVRVSVN